MFVVRSVIVCAAFLGVMYSALSFAVACAWWALRGMRSKSLETAGFLFGLRIFPFAISTLATVFLTLPSFWLMERRSFDEDMTTFFLAGFALLLLIAGAIRVLQAQSRTSQAVTEWLRNTGSDNEGSIAAVSAKDSAPALMLVGVCRSKVMVSDRATALLNDNELRVAIRHELGHRNSRDNLKKLVINATPFPGMRCIEQAWREAAELAADDAAVETRQDALDLASALIKLSRSSRQWSEPELASALACASSAINLRVHRLLQWRTRPRFRRTWSWALPSLLLFTAVVTNYGAALVLTHRLTELLVP